MLPREALKVIDTVLAEYCWTVPFFECSFAECDRGAQVSAAAAKGVQVPKAYARHQSLITKEAGLWEAAHSLFLYMQKRGENSEVPPFSKSAASSSLVYAKEYAAQLK